MKGRWIVLIIWFVMTLNKGLVAEAQDLENGQEEMLSKFDFEEIDRSLSDMFPEEKLDFSETVSALIQGDLEPSAELLAKLVSDQISYEFRYNKTALAHIIVIAIFAAIFTNFSGAFQNRQISEISFYILYLLLLTICLNAFRVTMEAVEVRLGALTEFMRVLAPAYFLALSISTGVTTSTVFYNVVLVLIYGVEMLVLNVLIPLVHIFIMTKVLDCLTKEEYLSQFAELVQKAITWSSKTLLGAVIGLNVVQGILSPAIDSLQRSVLTRGAEAIPGLGDLVGGVTEVAISTAVVIKNGIGIAGMVVCVAICAVPMLQMAVMTLMYKLTAALIQPVSDKRIVGCISGISEGAELLLRIIFTTGMLFLLTVAIVTASTN